MTKNALIPNPALKTLAILVGEWEANGNHPLMPGVAIHGHATFEWIEGGAFMRMYSEVDNPEIPNGVVHIGSDDEAERIMMIYFDSRGVSRHYEFSINDKEWKWWRNHPGFEQRFTVKIEDDGNTMTGKGEMRRDGGEWESDLNLTYTRIV